MESLSWEMLATIAGATAAVTMLTQIIKRFLTGTDPKWIALALSVIIQGGLFYLNGDFSIPNAVLAILNALIVVNGAIGLFEAGKEKVINPIDTAVSKLVGGKTDE